MDNTPEHQIAIRKDHDMSTQQITDLIFEIETIYLKEYL